MSTESGRSNRRNKSGSARSKGKGLEATSPAGSFDKSAARKETFVEAYLANGGNATKAAAAAGYRSPRMAGSRLLNDGKASGLLRARRSEVLAKAKQVTEITVAEVMGQLTSILRSDLRDAFDPDSGQMLPVHQWPEQLAKAVASVRFTSAAIGGREEVLLVRELRLCDKVMAIEKLMKYLGLFKEDNLQQRNMIVPASIVVQGLTPDSGSTESGR